MKIQRSLVLGAFLLIIFVGGAIVLAGTVPNTSSNPGTFSNNAAGEPPADSEPLTLNTVAYAEQIVQANVILPNLSALSSGFRIVGVTIAQPPMNATLSNGITY